jgi:hypothetical protein
MKRYKVVRETKERKKIVAGRRYERNESPFSGLFHWCNKSFLKTCGGWKYVVACRSVAK